MVGEGVAFVIAETATQAKDAADLVVVDYDPLPGSADTASALDDDATILWPDIGNNEALVHEIGDKPATENASTGPTTSSSSGSTSTECWEMRWKCAPVSLFTMGGQITTRCERRCSTPGWCAKFSPQP